MSLIIFFMGVSILLALTLCAQACVQACSQPSRQRRASSHGSRRWRSQVDVRRWRSRRWRQRQAMAADEDDPLIVTDRRRLVVRQAGSNEQSILWSKFVLGFIFNKKRAVSINIVEKDRENRQFGKSYLLLFLY